MDKKTRIDAILAGMARDNGNDWPTAAFDRLLQLTGLLAVTETNLANGDVDIETLEAHGYTDAGHEYQCLRKWALDMLIGGIAFTTNTSDAF